MDRMGALYNFPQWLQNPKRTATRHIFVSTKEGRGGPIFAVF
jgi:hypothetical protein